MERENKYLVIKNADIEKHLSDEQQLTLSSLITKIRVRRLHEGKVDQSYVVVAADWPMYEKVWGMIAAYVDGHPNELEKLEAENSALREQLSGMKSLFDAKVEQCNRFDVELHETKAQLAAVQKDADRYRWLKRKHQSLQADWHVRNQYSDPVGFYLDAAIDAAMKEE